MLWISTRSTLQTTNDGHPMWGTSLCLRWQSIRVSEHHHPWLHLEEEESKHCIPLCKGRRCQRWMANSIRQHSWKWGRPANETFAVRRQEKRFCTTRTPPYLRPMGKEQVRCNKTTNGLGLKCLNHLDEVDSFLTNHTRFILIFGFWFWILVLVFGFFDRKEVTTLGEPSTDFMMKTSCKSMIWSATWEECFDGQYRTSVRTVTVMNALDSR